MNEDMALVQKYAATKSDSVFSEIVARHLNLVYSAAMRQVRDPLVAQEVSQAVFIVLAQKADSMDADTILGGWLHRTTRFVALNALQAEQRRRQRETEAYMENDLHTQPAESIWREMMPLLDEALSRLKPIERDAIVLRYFENRSVEDVASALGLQENAAQKRVLRSLEKLRGFFAKRGVAVSTAAIVVVVSANSVQAAPPGLGAAVVAATHTSTATASTLTLVKGALKAMFWANLKLPLAATASFVIVFCGLYLAGATPQGFFWHRDAGSPAWVVTGAAPLVEGLPLEFRGHAERFKIYNPGALDEVQIPIQLMSGHVNIFVAEDNGGLPGAVLEEFQEVDAPHVGAPYSLDLRSVAHPELRKNVNYWLCAEPAGSDTVAAWFYDTNFLAPSYAEKEGNAWATLDPRGAIKNVVGHFPNAIYRGQNYAALLVVKGAGRR